MQKHNILVVLASQIQHEKLKQWRCRQNKQKGRNNLAKCGAQERKTKAETEFVPLQPLQPVFNAFHGLPAFCSVLPVGPWTRRGLWPFLYMTFDPFSVFFSFTFLLFPFTPSFLPIKPTPTFSSLFPPLPCVTFRTRVFPFWPCLPPVRW